MNTDLMKLKNDTIKFTIKCILIILSEIFLSLIFSCLLHKPMYSDILFIILQIVILGSFGILIQCDWDYYLYFDRFYEYINTSMAQELFKVQVGVEDDYMKFIVYLHNIMYTMPGIKKSDKFVTLPDFLHNEIINYIEENYTIYSKDAYILDDYLDKLIFISKDTKHYKKMLKYYKKRDKLEDKLNSLNKGHKKYLHKLKKSFNLRSIHD